MQIKKSDTQVALYAALARAQSQISVPSKNAVNPAFKSRYVDLSAVLAAVLPAWNANGLAISQFPVVSEDCSSIELTTLISHTSGEWMESSIRMPVGKRDPHGIGSAITYARRYTVASIAGLMQDDDDGNLASQVDVSRVEARNVVRSTAPAVAPKPSAEPAAAPVQAPAVEPDPAPAAASETRSVVRFSPKAGIGGVTLPDAQESAQASAERIDEVQVDSHELVGGALTTLQMATGIKSRSNGELAYPLFEEWAQAIGRGQVADWPLSKQKQALEWIEKGGWQTVRQWQARQQAAAERTHGEQVADAVDRLLVEDEVQGSEEGQASAAPKRARRTKAEMEAARAAVAQGDAGGAQ
jgi:hypothetical protein